MALLDRLLAQLTPYDCLVCGREGQLLCQACQGNLPAITSRCYRCRRLTPDFATCPSCRSSSSLRRVYVATVYDDVAKDIVWQLKFNGAQAAAGVMASTMTAAYPVAGMSLVVPVVAATSRVRRRGYDQSRLLARQFAWQTRLPVANVLARTNQARQVGAHRQQRLHQLQHAFRVARAPLVHGQHLLLVDDVVTTGATLEAAAQSLRAAGAKTVDAITFAQP